MSPVVCPKWGCCPMLLTLFDCYLSHSIRKSKPVVFQCHLCIHSRPSLSIHNLQSFWLTNYLTNLLANGWIKHYQFFLCYDFIQNHILSVKSDTMSGWTFQISAITKKMYSFIPMSANKAMLFSLSTNIWLPQQASNMIFASIVHFYSIWNKKLINSLFLNLFLLSQIVNCCTLLDSSLVSPPHEHQIPLYLLFFL